MSSISKNVWHCNKCVPIVATRYLNTDASNVLDTVKMQAKTVVLTQWKVLNQLKLYFSKFTVDKTFENDLNIEFDKFLQKIDQKLFRSDVIKYFTSVASKQTKQLRKTEHIEEQTSIISLPSVLKVNNKEEIKKQIIPRWKTAKTVISKEAVSSRTTHVLSSLLRADSDGAKLASVTDLITHIKQYPEAKHNAVKEGTIRTLLRIQKSTAYHELQCALKEAFALLGYSHPVPGSGIRILSMDGGGTRGVLVIEMLRKLEEFSGKPIYEMFDIICGVSTGAIIATLAGLKQHTLDETSEIYKNISQQIFSQSTLKGTSNLVWSHSYYDTDLWEKLLKEQWDDRTLIDTQKNLKCPKFCAVSAVVNQSRLSAYVFRNYSLPCNVQSQYLGGYNHKVWEAVRASAAAPTYFEEFKLGSMVHQDGGILVNNPTAVAIHEAKLLWPTTPIQCVVSFGTGRTVPNPIYPNAEPMPICNTSWKSKFFAIIDSATDTEGVHTMLSDLLPPDVYYRFNPYLTDTCDMAEINPGKLEQLKRDAIMYLRRNEDKFQEVVKALHKSKTPAQKFLDWVSLQKEIHGFRI